VAGLCSFSAVTSSTCGSSRGFTECVALNSCAAIFIITISSHLQNHHLSRENVCEEDLILARAGLLELTEEQVKNITVCLAQRFTLGKYWQAPMTCQYPKHHGKKTAVTGTHVINFKLARVIKNIFGEATPIGSRKF